MGMCGRYELDDLSEVLVVEKNENEVRAWIESHESGEGVCDGEAFLICGKVFLASEMEYTEGQYITPLYEVESMPHHGPAYAVDFSRNGTLCQVGQ